jgi:antitoxin component of RelBE/YafQ-DinJ toxin-antitoxin module
MTDKIKVNMYIDAEVLRQIDEYAKLNGITRSGAISVLTMQTIQTNKSLNMLAKFQDMINGQDKKPTDAGAE